MQRNAYYIDVSSITLYSITVDKVSFGCCSCGESLAKGH